MACSRNCRLSSKVQQNSQRLEGKTDEIADIVKSTYENSTCILQEMQQIHAKLDKILLTMELKDINEATQTIDNCTHDIEHYGRDHSQERLKKAESMLWKAYIQLSRIFETRTIADKYRQFLEKDPSNSFFNVDMALTLWFRGMLEYQMRAFSLSVGLRVFIGDYEPNQIQSKVFTFRKLIQQQLETHKDLIDENLVCESEQYISMQVKKAKTIRQACKWLSPNP